MAIVIENSMLDDMNANVYIIYVSKWKKEK